MFLYARPERLIAVRAYHRCQRLLPAEALRRSNPVQSRMATKYERNT